MKRLFDQSLMAFLLAMQSFVVSFLAPCRAFAPSIKTKSTLCTAQRTDKIRMNMSDKLNGDDENKEKDLFFDSTLKSMKDNESLTDQTETAVPRQKSAPSFETYKTRPKCPKWNFQQQDFPPEVYNIDPLPSGDSQSETSRWGEIFGQNSDVGVSGAKTFGGEGTISATSDDYFRATRLVRGRSYARQDAFQLDRLYELPDLQDLASPPNPEYADDNLWTFKNGALWFQLKPFRLALLGAAFFSFGPAVHFLYTYLPSVDKLDILSESNFVPGISIVFGTYLSLTLSILYSRQQKITELCAKETSQLLQLTRRIFQLFDETNATVDIPVGTKSSYKIAAAEYIADQVRILVKTSRGRELMKIIYSDPYEGIDKVLNDYRDELVTTKNQRQQQNGDSGEVLDISSSMALVNSCTDLMPNLVLSRSERLSNESTFLPPAHFVVARVLAAMIIIGYTVATVPMVDDQGNPPIISSAFFAVLFAVYLFFSTIISDLNNPFSGVYQIRRSGIAANLLAIKWIIQKDPTLACEVNFEGEVGHPILWQDPIQMQQLAEQQQQSRDELPENSR